MKRIICTLLTIALSVATCVGLFACEIPDVTPNDPVSIKYEADGSAIIPLFVQGKANYAVLGEPAATNLANKMKKDKNVTVYTVFDLQQLWKNAVGSQNNGYPQACMIVKKELLANKTFVTALTAAMNDNANYIATNMSTLAATMKAHGSSLTVNYTSDLIARCNLNFVSANSAGTSSDVNKYLAEFGFSADADKPVNKLPDDGFYYDGTSVETTAPESISLYVPDGAPALSVAKIIAEGKIGETAVNVNLSTGEDVVAKAMNGEADVVVLPTNAAAKVYNAKKQYSMFSVNVYGVLYVVSTENITKLSDLSGKLVYSIGLGNTPEYVFKKVLSVAGIGYVDAE